MQGGLHGRATRKDHRKERHGLPCMRKGLPQQTLDRRTKSQQYRQIACPLTGGTYSWHHGKQHGRDVPIQYRHQTDYRRCWVDEFDMQYVPETATATGLRGITMSFC